MSNDITNPEFTTPSSDLYAEEEAALATAHAQAVAELNRLREQASIDDKMKGENPDYSLHEAKDIGQYVIPRRTGWKALLKIIHDPVPNIDFSANIYPAFDGILGDHFQSPYLLDPLDDHYESYEDLRDNLAAVRNFLLQTYYANTPDGMSPEKAKTALAEIAGFVGDGLYNNWLFLGLVPNHNPSKPFIDLSRAREGGGKGAQYIYEKILEYQRHSSWLRPFEKLTELFGGKVHPDWKLPPANQTHFRDFAFKTIKEDMSPEQMAAMAIANAQNRATAIEDRLSSIRDARALSTTATDLDAIGNHLLYTAQHMEEGVAHLSEPVRVNAVEIARDILRKLKLSIGGAATLDGLNMKPTDDMATLGAIKGVATVYERLLAWARSNNDAGILQHPSVIAATRAIGQLGLLAKLEGLRMAELAGNTALSTALREQIKRVPEAFKTTRGTTFGDLFDAIESGMNTILYRTQQVSVTGAKVGFSRENTLGQNLSSAPTAGIANQVNASQAAAERNAQAAQADQQAALAQAQKMHAQMAASARAAQQQGQQASTQAPPPQPSRSNATVGRSALRNAQNQQRTTPVKTNITSSATPLANLTPAQQMQAQRNATQAAAAQASREREEQLKHELQRQQQQQLLAKQQAQKAAAAAFAKVKATAQSLPPGMAESLRNSVSLKGVTGAPVVTGRAALNQKIQAEIAAKAPPAPPPGPAGATPISTNPNDPLRNPYVVPTPTGPKPSGPGRGF